MTPPATALKPNALKSGADIRTQVSTEEWQVRTDLYCRLSPYGALRLG